MQANQQVRRAVLDSLEQGDKGAAALVKEVSAALCVTDHVVRYTVMMMLAEKEVALLPGFILTRGYDDRAEHTA